MAARLNMFTFGYWGWGSATRELVRRVDAVERRRGFRSPIFVDIRIHRGVRAAGFRDDAFERFLGRARYRWMRGLGNLAVVGHSGGRRVKINSPAAATELLEFAREDFCDFGSLGLQRKRFLAGIPCCRSRKASSCLTAEAV